MTISLLTRFIRQDFLKINTIFKHVGVKTINRLKGKNERFYISQNLIEYNINMKKNY